MTAVNRRVRLGTRLTVQRLEPRLPLAGNVTATLGDGVLTLQGDAFDNGIELRADVDDALLVLGTRDTSIVMNGASSAQRRFAEVRAVRIRLDGGADQCVFAGVRDYLVDSIDINTGPGADTISLGMGRVTGTMLIATGPDADFVDLTLAKVLGTLRVQTGAGADRISAESLLVAGSLLIDTGGGDDVVGFVNTNDVRGVVQILTRGGNDVVEVLDGIDDAASLLIDAGDGDDDVVVEGAGIRGNVTLLSGAGLDDVVIGGAARTNVGGSLRIDGGVGDDTVALQSEIEIDGDVSLRLGDGTDTTTTTGRIVVLGSVRVDLGAGSDDAFTVAGVAGNPIGRTLDVAGDLTIVKPSGSAIVSMKGADPNGPPLVGRDLLVSAAAAAAITVSIDGVSTGRDVRVMTGVGADRVLLTSLNVGRRLLVATSAGADRITSNSVTYGGDVRLLAGSGDDDIKCTTGRIRGRLFARLGAGDDVLNTNDLVIGASDLVGGPGLDTLVTDMLLNIVPLNYSGFETIVS